MLAENDITLHIMIDEELSVNKSKAKDMLFGKQLVRVSKINAWGQSQRGIEIFQELTQAQRTPRGTSRS